MTFYLKYRSQTIEELDLASVRETLKKIISMGNMPHAFLFAGPKGTGKTSAARILAKVINCEKIRTGGVEPCNKCNQCISISKEENIDVVEMDAASNRGIDDVRSLREMIRLSPASAKKKVYIVDEAHMLTAEASNAFLKTLEEPPEHVVFILATTNPEKLIETIRSRTTIIKFNKATIEEIVRSLKRVAKGEKIETAEEVLKLIAKAANGAFRDGHKLLETLVTDGVDLNKSDSVEDYLFKSKTASPEILLGYLKDCKTKEAVDYIEQAVGQGVSMTVLTDSLIEYVHAIMLEKVKSGKTEEDLSVVKLASLIHSLYVVKEELKLAALEQVPLQLAVIEWCENNNNSIEEYNKSNGNVDNGNKSEIGGKTFSEDKTNTGIKDFTAQTPEDTTKGSEEEVSKKTGKVPTDGVAENQEAATIAQLKDGVWRQLLSEIRPKNASTEALLRAARPMEFDGKVLSLGVFYSFHKEKLESNPHRIILEEALSHQLGFQVRVSCVLTQPDKKEIIAVSEKVVSDKHEQKSEVVLTEAKHEDIMNIAEKIFGN